MSTVQAVIAASTTFALLYLAALTALAVVLALRLGEHREYPVAGDREVLSASRFTIPVSIVMPVGSGAQWTGAGATIEALLGLNYSNFEVIVVADDLRPGVWDSTKAAWQLEAREIFFRALLGTAPIRMMYRSARDPRLIVVHKGPGPAADALNCGVNLARFRYVCAVEPGIAFDADALSRAMSAPLRDPANVVGATSHVETRGGVLQRLRSIRSVMDSCVAWRHLQAAVAPRDAIVVWRRDTLEHAGGFSTAAADPQLELMIRLQLSTWSMDAPGRLVRTSEVFGHRPPRAFVEDMRRTVRRQLAAVRALASLPKANAATRAMLAYFVVLEVLTPGAQALAVAATSACAAAGWLPWTDIGLVLFVIAAGHAIVAAAALLVRGAVSHAPETPRMAA